MLTLGDELIGSLPAAGKFLQPSAGLGKIPVEISIEPFLLLSDNGV